MTTQRLLISDTFCLIVLLYIYTESSLYSYTETHCDRNPMQGDEQQTSFVTSPPMQKSPRVRTKSFSTRSVLVAELRQRKGERL